MTRKVETTKQRVESKASWLEVQHAGLFYAVKGYRIKKKKSPPKKQPLGFRPPS